MCEARRECLLELLLSTRDIGFHTSTRKVTAVHDLDASLCRIRVEKSDAGNSVGLLIVQHDVGHLPQLGTLFTDVFLDVENGSRIIL